MSTTVFNEAAHPRQGNGRWEEKTQTDQGDGALGARPAVWGTRSITVTPELAESLDEAAAAAAGNNVFARDFVGCTITDFYWGYDSRYDNVQDDLNITVTDPACPDYPLDIEVACVEADEDEEPYRACEAPFVAILGAAPNNYQ